MRITKWNLENYLSQTYGGTPRLTLNKQLDDFFPLLQKDYGEANDCTLTSITAIIYYLSEQKLDIQTVYNTVEKYAKKYGYKGDKGTPALTIRKIFQKSLAAYNMPNAYGKFVKGVGYNFDTIKYEINKGNPLILSLNDDGQSYYKNHSVTVVGYVEASVNSKKTPMIIIYDNWYKGISYIDYNKLSLVSSVHFSDLTFKQKRKMFKNLK